MRNLEFASNLCFGLIEIMYISLSYAMPLGHKSAN